MFSSSLDSKALGRLPEIVRKAEEDTANLLRDWFLTEGATRILHKAKELCPVLWEDLRDSGRLDRETYRSFISFGGEGRKLHPPREYAEEIHEDRGISHEGPRSARWVYLYLKGYLGELHEGGMKYAYAKRDPAEAHPKRGQAHFLFGDDGDSALELTLPGLVALMEEKGTKAFGMYMKM